MHKLIKRALISVSNKENLDKLLPLLKERNVEIISTGGTENFIREKGYEVTSLLDFTGKTELFDGRVKTLDFKIYSSLLFDRTNALHVQSAKEHDVAEIDLVVCNLYPFEDVAKKTDELHELIENIDIGGPCMLRASAKNYKSVCVLNDVSQYDEFIDQFEQNGGTEINFRLKCAKKVFDRLAQYNEAIAFKLDQVTEDETNYMTLRYGENSHQKAWFKKSENGFSNFSKLHGKELSYNNYLDMEAAYWSCFEADEATQNKYSCVSIIKHNNPCGLALNKDSILALENAWAGDPKSAFGSIICFNEIFTNNMASFFNDKFIEVIMAPDFELSALEKLKEKKNLRIIKIDTPKEKTYLEKKTIYGGLLIQERDSHIDREFQTVTQTQFGDDMKELFSLGSVLGKSLKSNAICFISMKDNGYWLSGAGMGQPNRIDSMELLAAKRAQENGARIEESLMVSDAFFPFRDTIDSASQLGVKYIVQPGGSIKDQEVIEACNEHKIAMCFTNYRHFKH